MNKKSVFLLCALALAAFACEKTDDETGEGATMLIDQIRGYDADHGKTGDNKLICQFEYDSQNRAVKVTEDDGDMVQTFVYNGEELVSARWLLDDEVDQKITFQKNGNTVIGTEVYTQVYNGHSSTSTGAYTITLTDNDTPAKIIYTEEGDDYNRTTTSTYLYDDKGNVIQINAVANEVSKSLSSTHKYKTTYTYDDKKSPMSACNTPKWAWFLLDYYNGEGVRASYYGNNFAKVEMKSWQNRSEQEEPSWTVTTTYDNKYNEDGVLSSMKLTGNGFNAGELSFTYKNVK